MAALNKNAFPVDLPGLQRSERLISVDLLRGLAMIVMALDHVRDFFTYHAFAPEDLTQTYGWLFLTRWLTHYAAPTFFFLAGTGAYLSLGRGRSVAQVSRFLWTRGLWLVFLELTVVGFAWTFVPGQSYGGVIWALGWCMVLMSLLVRLPVKWLATLGLAMIALHNLTDRIDPARFGRLAPLWTILHVPGAFPVTKTLWFFILYALIPWVGVMAVGYAFGAILRRPPDERQRSVFRIGAVATLLFIVLRAAGLYGNLPDGLQFGIPFSTGPWVHGKTLTLTIISFFNPEKYPPSLQFLLMTLGPALMVLAVLDRWTQSGKLKAFTRFVVVYGRVPMFYYIVHIFLIHAMTIVVSLIMHQPYGQMLHGGFFAGPPESGYGHHLPFIYLMWATAVLLLWLPCSWFAGVKQRHKNWWLSYL
jgi:uncharacterized membrane protein